MTEYSYIERNNMLTITECQNDDIKWEEYVSNNNNASVYHQLGWKNIIEKTFGHQGIFLIVQEDGQVKGILPLIFMKNFIFGRYIISLPFVDSSGVLADTPQVATILCNRAIEICKENQANFLELRNQQEITHNKLTTVSHKVNLVLSLAEGPEFLWKKVFHENIRNKVRKALKSGVSIELGSDFYHVHNFYKILCKNMRDLGTPVYPKKFLLNILQTFPEQVIIFLAREREKVIGGKLVFIYKDTMSFLYHSSLREYAKLAPNNLLYWVAIQYACEKGLRYCNMGRSTRDSGPYNFKKQWGGEVRQLYWQYYLRWDKELPNLNPANPKFSLAIKIWKRLPLFITNLLGPMIAKHLP